MKHLSYYTGLLKPNLMYQRAYGTGQLIIENENYNKAIVQSEPKYLIDSDELYLISSDNFKLMVRG